MCCRAGSAEDRAFTDKHKAAFESKDAKTLESFLVSLHNRLGSERACILQSTMTGGAGSTMSSIELVALTPEEIKKAAEP